MYLYSGYKIISGYTIGHLYDYLKYIMPETLGYNLLETPSVFNWMVDKMENRQAQQAEEVSLYYFFSPIKILKDRSFGFITFSISLFSKSFSN